MASKLYQSNAARAYSPSRRELARSDSAPTIGQSSPAYKPPHRRHRMRNPQAAQGILRSALRTVGIDREMARYNFVLHWHEIVGEKLALITRPECLRQNTLVVRVKDSTWAQELSFLKPMILKRLAKFMETDDRIDDVVFYVGGS